MRNVSKPDNPGTEHALRRGCYSKKPLSDLADRAFAKVIKENFVLTPEGVYRAKVRVFRQLLSVVLPLELILAVVLVWVFPIPSRDMFFTLTGFAVVICIFCANLWSKAAGSFRAWGLHLDKESVYLTTDPESTEIRSSQVTHVIKSSSGLIVKGCRSGQQIWIPTGVEDFAFLEKELRGWIGDTRGPNDADPVLRDDDVKAIVGFTRYQDPQRGFGLDLPNGWHKAGMLRQRLGPGPEFYGPDGSSLKVAIGRIDPVPTLEQQKKNLQRIATRYGHIIISIDELEVGGKRHATMTCKVPGVGILKNYSLIYGWTEYFVTAGGRLELADSIVKTLRKLS